MPQRPQGSHRRPDPDAWRPDPDTWRPDEHLRPLPPEYEPAQHEPGYDDSRYDDPRPTRPHPSRPEATRWHPAQASYDQGETHPQDPYGERLPYHERDQYQADPDYEDDYGTGGRFVPGFADDGGADDDYDRAGSGGRRAGRRGRRGTGPDSRGTGPDGRGTGPDGRGGGRGSRGGGRGSRRTRRRFRWIAPLFALLVIVVPLVIGGVYAYSFYMSKYHPADYSGDGTGSVVVQVTSGDTPTSLGPKLVKLGVVASSRAFVLAAEHSSNPSGLLPGFYGMHEHMKASLAYALLLDPKNLVQVTVTIPEGWRLGQIVAWLGAKSGIPVTAYQKALKDPASLGLPAFAGGKPEGYLFPATYAVQPHETALGVLQGMVQAFDQEAARVDLAAAARQVHLSEGQVIIMASLVQAEGGRLSDYPKIARVIYNRLAQGMPLQLDSTVLYGLNRFGILASDQELKSPSRYNTYRYKGLPPGPIDNPGNAAIQAVLHPAHGNWLYFVTVNPKTGETLFTSSQAQFEQFRQELQKHLGQR